MMDLEYRTSVFMYVQIILLVSPLFDSHVVLIKLMIDTIRFVRQIPPVE